MEKKKVLIVDDSEVLCQTMKARIEENGAFDVRMEHKGNLALAAAKQFNPDVILLDIMMPDLDGVSVAIHLHKDASTRNIPIMFLTAIAREEDLQAHGDIYGGYQVIPKSVSTDDLISSLHKNTAKDK